MTALNLDSGAQVPTAYQPQHISSPDSPIVQTIEAPLKFEIPEGCRTFSPFARLPPEIRAQIWQNTLNTPGMHFLKVEAETETETLSTGTGRWWMKESLPNLFSISSDEEDQAGPMTAADVKKLPAQKATLQPLYPTQTADISYYISLHKQLAKLTVTCNESASIARSLVNRPTAFRLSSGRLVSLDRSDVIYLEYLPPDCYEGGIRFIRTLQCPGLDQIRKVAMRYCHKWSQKAQRRCPNCGQLHDNHNPTYPKHLYQFLAQYLPNLEEFYFVDYLILPKSPSVPPGTFTSSFEGGNRSFFEVDEQNWKISSHVLECKSWLQGQFIKYTKASKLNKHKNPERVKFGVLACQWRVEPPVTPRRAPVTPVKKGRNKRAHSEEHCFLSRARGPISPVAYLPHEATVHYPFVFDACGSNRYEFTFSMTL
ncbi:hypothetical protein NW768_004383 [Fusarium equiseti]|uniref:2EXR domain-containing protein n=1 Tax=Fusarium equiseti TaxID=61235 RepID=A0ABQ8RG35_FUSEQ|nr:hypothetical protein NW768_004383 [Fusarium equiseti]